MLTISQKYLTELARAAIFDGDAALPPDGVDWAYIYEKSAEQNITGLIASSVLRLPEEVQPDNADAWNDTMMQTMLVMSRRFAEFERMREVLCENSVEPVCLKGIVAKDLYPVPELRTMGDFDVLVSDIAKAKAVFEKEGYSIVEDALYFEAKRGDANWEVFSSLENEFRIDSARYDRIISEHSDLTRNNMRTVEDTYFAAHEIVHAAKHIMHQGAGIRNICDIALIFNKFDIDYDILENICKEQKCLKVYKYIMDCVNEFFGINTVHTFGTNTEVFTEYILCYGVFGNISTGNVLAPQAAKNEEDISYIRKIFFPPVKMLDYKYRYLKKHPYLLPFAWVHRVFEARRRWGYSVKDMLKSVRGVSEYSRERDSWMKKLEINDE